MQVKMMLMGISRIACNDNFYDDDDNVIYDRACADQWATFHQLPRSFNDVPADKMVIIIITTLLFVIILMIILIIMMLTVLILINYHDDNDNPIDHDDDDFTK